MLTKFAGFTAKESHKEEWKGAQQKKGTIKYAKWFNDWRKLLGPKRKADDPFRSSRTTHSSCSPTYRIGTSGAYGSGEHQNRTSLEPATYAENYQRRRSDEILKPNEDTGIQVGLGIEFEQDVQSIVTKFKDKWVKGDKNEMTGCYLVQLLRLKHMLGGCDWRNKR